MVGRTEGYMVTLTQLNNKCGTNPTTSRPLMGHLGPNYDYYKATNGLGCYMCFHKFSLCWIFC
jgi:hypothetical protein